MAQGAWQGQLVAEFAAQAAKACCFQGSRKQSAAYLWFPILKLVLTGSSQEQAPIGCICKSAKFCQQMQQEGGDLQPCFVWQFYQAVRLTCLAGDSQPPHHRMWHDSHDQG